MSLAYLLVAVRDQLRDNLFPEFETLDILVMPGPEPPPYCGQKFISVYGIGWEAGPDDDQVMGLDEVYSVSCAVTYRAPSTPFDRRGDELYIKSLTGMEKTCREIIRYVHQNLDVFNSWVSMVESYSKVSTPDLPVEYLRFTGVDPAPIPQDGSWFSAEPEDAAGMVMEVRFSGARTLHSINPEDRLE